MLNQLKSSILAATFSILTSASILLSIGTATAAEDNQNYIAPSFGLVNNRAIYGINTKFRIGDSISLRPFIKFYNSSEGGSSALYGTSATYNFISPNSRLIPYIGLGVAEVTTAQPSSNKGGFYLAGGVDYNATDNLVINADYVQGTNGLLTIGAGYRF
jgi:opacity protein-like surface antigen